MKENKLKIILLIINLFITINLLQSSESSDSDQCQLNQLKNQDIIIKDYSEKLYNYLSKFKDKFNGSSDDVKKKWSNFFSAYEIAQMRQEPGSWKDVVFQGVYLANIKGITEFPTSATFKALIHAEFFNQAADFLYNHPEALEMDNAQFAEKLINCVKLIDGSPSKYLQIKIYYTLGTQKKDKDSIKKAYDLMIVLKDKWEKDNKQSLLKSSKKLFDEVTKAKDNNQKEI